MKANLVRIVLSGLCFVLVFSPMAASAQVLNDPTRPPASLGSTADMDADGGGGTVLQSVIISPTNKAAIISGVMVKLGEKYGDAVLVKVAENEVVLKSGTTSQVLKLLPGVERRDSVSAAARESAPRSNTRNPAPQ
jgi:MSHA biogenesis protein MshK